MSPLSHPVGQDLPSGTFLRRRRHLPVSLNLTIPETAAEWALFGRIPSRAPDRGVPEGLPDLLALGFTGPEPDSGVMGQLGLWLDPRGNFARDAGFGAGPDGVFVAGDAGRGASLIVWAVAEGRAAAAAVDRYLMGSTTLPAPIQANDRPLSA